MQMAQQVTTAIDALKEKIAARTARVGIVGLGYVGADIVIDANEGPLLLEANARPGLAIQIANARGLLPRLREIDLLSEYGVPNTHTPTKKAA